MAFIDLNLNDRFQINFRAYRAKTFKIVGIRDIGSPAGLQYDYEQTDVPRNMRSDGGTISAKGLESYDKHKELTVIEGAA